MRPDNMPRPFAPAHGDMPSIVRFRISYRNGDATYRVSIPNYEGGEVVNAEAYDALAEQRAELLEVLGRLVKAYDDDDIRALARICREARAATAKCGVKP